MAYNVTLQTNHGLANQRWKFESGNGYYTIVNKATGEVLDLAGAQTAEDTNIGTYTRNGSDAQLFKVILANNGLAYHHTISPKLDTSKFLTAVGNGITDKNINIHSNLNNSKQRFWLRKETDGYYLIIHGYTGLVLTA